jgi:hypothetical protein
MLNAPEAGSPDSSEAGPPAAGEKPSAGGAGAGADGAPVTGGAADANGAAAGADGAPVTGGAADANGAAAGAGTGAAGSANFTIPPASFKIDANAHLIVGGETTIPLQVRF